MLMEGELRNLEAVDQYIEDHFRFPIQKVTQLNMPTVLTNYPTSYKKNGKELLSMNSDNQFLEASVQVSDAIMQCKLKSISWLTAED
jgi:hypothetical protein